MTYDIPGGAQLTINTIILDLNGTLSVGGQVPVGVKERLNSLMQQGFKLVLFTGNTRGDAETICNDLGIEWRQAGNADEKQQLAAEFTPEKCAAIGNGRIDLQLIQSVALGVVTLQAEGVHVQTLLNADIVVPSIVDALDLFLDSDRLLATLRK